MIDLDEVMITLDRRDAERPGRVRPDAGETEVGYMFLPEAWTERTFAQKRSFAAHDQYQTRMPP